MSQAPRRSARTIWVGPSTSVPSTARSAPGGPDGECGKLYEEIVNQLRATQYRPSQVIYGYDPWPLERWNFEMSNHHDHIHIGY